MYGDTRQQAGWDTIEKAAAGAAGTLAWRSLRGAANASGPSRLELSGDRPAASPPARR